MNCTHTRQIPGKYVDVFNDWTGETDQEWQAGYEESTYDDLDLHRLKCTKCGHITYYSGAARNYYENGVRSPGITGLE